ncbi:MAG: TonB-dependent receptor [Parabacteroides sp.]|nr:TonB-dependent receptor [Parabacteroides sp.]
MNSQNAISKSRLGLALCCLLAGGAVLPQSSMLRAEVSVAQQQRTVKGVVTDTKGEPLLGVNVIVKGTTNGTITDLDGNFSLEVEPNAILEVSYIGYVTQQVPANGTSLKITLKEDTQNLDEVVVVGYGTQQKKDITGSVAVVDTEQLLASSGSSATQQLQGKAAGVQIGTNGAPGSATMVRIRGINSINDNGPLYVIDGVSTRDQDLSSLNPNDIESMQVLKDASSAAIYGAQAANGVILITTKKGTRSGQPKLTYDGYVGMTKTGHKYSLLSGDDLIQAEWQATKNSLDLAGDTDLPSHLQFGASADSWLNHKPNYMTVTGAGGRTDIQPTNYEIGSNVYAPVSNTDWWDEISQIGIIQNHQATLSGGTEKGQYIMSANYFDQKGTVIESYYKRYQVRANTIFNLRDWLRVGENLTYSFGKNNNLSHSGTESNIYSWTYRACPYVPVYDSEGNYAGSKIAGTGNWQNPVAILERNKDNYYTTQRVFGNIYAEVDFMKGLTFKTNFGLDYRNDYYYAISKKNPEFSETTGQNSFSENNYFNYRWVWTNTLNFNRTFNEKHAVTVLLGTEAIRDGLGRSLYGYRTNYLFEDNPNTYTLTMGENNAQRNVTSSYNGEFALFGMFARADYAYDNKYLFTGIVRRDGVSRFSESNRYGVFPSFSFGWRLSEEGFMEKTRDWLDDLKLRVGYGITGNSEIPVATNFANIFSTSTTATNYDLTGANTSEQTAYRLATYGNSDTKWEKNKMVNVGIDATFAGGKFGGTFEWYNKKTSDMLIQAAYTSLAGEAGSPYINFGNIKNTGWDFTFNYRDSKGDWAWDIDLNLSHYKNTVERLAAADDYSLWASGTRIEGYVTRTTKGHAVSEFWGFVQDGFYETAQDVVNTLPVGKSEMSLADAETWVGRFKFKDLNGDGKLDDNDRTFIGSPHPDLTGGVNATLKWKNWDLTMFWNFSIGNDLYNNTKYFTDFWTFKGNKSERLRDQSWTLGADNSNAILPILNSADSYSGTYSSSYYVEDASFLRLKNLVLGYTIPKAPLQKVGIQNIRVYVQAENLLTITGYTGLDPEFTNAYLRQSDTSTRVDLQKGVDMGGWPTTMRMLFGVNFVF